jgi:hypothetical protein
MFYPLKSSFSRAMGLLGLLALGVVQGGCAHPVFVEPSVSVHSRIGHFPVHAQVGLPGPVIYAPPPRVIYAPPPRVIYAPPPPPRVVLVPRAIAPVDGWGHGHERRWGHERKRQQRDERGNGRGGRGHRDDERR